MMSGVSLETCWAFNKHWNNKFYHKAASCWYFHWVIYDAQIHEHQIHNSFTKSRKSMPISHFPFRSLWGTSVQGLCMHDSNVRCLLVSVWHLLTQFVPSSSIVHSTKGHVMHLPSQPNWSHDWITVWKWAFLIRAGRPLLFCFRSLANVLLACTLIQYK
jgi:hypothetical protein